MPGSARLTNAERAALLRATRDRLRVLERDLEMWEDRVLRGVVPNAKAQRDIVRDEWALLSEAVRKLWIGVIDNGE